MQDKTILNMGDGKVFAVLLGLSGPAMISMFFQNLYALVDTIFVSWLGTVELAALSLTIPVLYLGMALAKGIAVGSTTLMSHARGGDNEKKATTICRASLPFALLILTPLCLLILPEVNGWIFGLFKVDQTILQQVHKFMFWLGLTFPVMGFAMICEGVFLSYGDAKTPMKAMITGNVLNIILDPFFIFTCKMGIAGASLASFIGWLTAGLIMFSLLKRHKKDTPTFLCKKEECGVWREIITLGGPVALALLVMPLSAAGLNYVLAPFGAAYVGAWALSSRLEQMIILPLYGLSCSLIPFVGFNLGAGSRDRIYEAVRISLKICYIIIVPVSLLLWFYAPAVIGLFRPGPEVLKLSSFAFRMALLGYCLVPVELIVVGLAQGIRRPKFTLLINIFRLILLRLPLAFLFAHLWSGEGTYISHTVSMILSGFFCIFLLRHLLRLVDSECRLADKTKNECVVDNSSSSKPAIGDSA